MQPEVVTVAAVSSFLILGSIAGICLFRGDTQVNHPGTVVVNVHPSHQGALSDSDEEPIFV
ncbi:MAG: hypothetical protein KVP17_002977 [Porospora cf. gigantea B]|uniref:uncharacterized protein n=1 Tax=Porospora cf. gigantea B TaxID=2853592 RepID=UPI003571DB77|nr:MAG: hypothetical protein KVP17_002977 [Porospora cf. gigantea B]